MAVSVSTYHSSFVHQVSPHLNSGLNLFLQILLNLQTEQGIEHGDENILQLLKHVQSATRHLDQAKEIAANHKKDVDHKLEDSEYWRQQYNTELSKVNDELNLRNNKCNSITDEKDRTENEFRNSQRQLNSAENALGDAREKLAAHDGFATLSGVVLTAAVPVIGWFYGMTYGIAAGASALFTYSVLESNVKEAKYRVMSLRNYVRQSELNFENVRSRYKKLHAELSNLRTEKDKLERKKSQLVKDIELLKYAQKEISRVQYKLGEFTHYLSVLSAKMDVLHDETLTMYSTEPLINIIKDLSTILETPPDYLISEINVDNLKLSSITG